MAVQDNCTITPVISKSSADFIEGLVKDARDEGRQADAEVPPRGQPHLARASGPCHARESPNYAMLIIRAQSSSNERLFCHHRQLLTCLC